MRYRWKLPLTKFLETRLLAQSLGIGEVAAASLTARGLGDPVEAAAFLEPRLKSLSDPFRIPGMKAAVERVWAARGTVQQLVLFGDYDVDGVTAVTLLSEVLTHLGWSVAHYLPNRFGEGYGLTHEAAENCRRQYPAARLWMAVDCGTTAVEPVAWLKREGVEVVVLDHHQPGPTLPPVAALVNPQLGTEFRELCSVGLAFKFAHALLKHGRDAGDAAFGDFDLRPLLDLVALGTIADLVPLTGENRILAQAGLQKLESTGRPGLQALKEVAGVEGRMRVDQVGYQLGPRLNAAGRLETALNALELLLARDAAVALPLAQRLDACNRERQEIERRISEDVMAAVRGRFNPERDFVVVEAHLEWHVGVVGIVASRILREFYRPTLIIGGDGAECRGSGRSIPGFDLASALRQCDDLLLKHGGHAMAAGVTIALDQVGPLRERLNQIAQGCLQPENLVPELRLDAQVQLTAINADTMAELARLEPFGQGNPPVQLLVAGLRHAHPPQRLGRDQKHWKFVVTDGGPPMECVWWGAGDRAVPSGTFDLAVVPEVNEYNGRTQIRLRFLDWRPAQASTGPG